MFTPVQHPVTKAFDAEELTAAGGAADTATSEWFDASAWTEKTVAVLQSTAGTPDLDVKIHISEQHYYELNNKTATTADYESVDIVTGLSAETWTQYDPGDVDELQRTFRSWRVYIENDCATHAATVSVWLGGAA